VPAESPPNGTISCLRRRPESLVGDLHRFVRVVYGIGRAVPAHERSLAWRYREQVAAAVEIAPITAEEFEELLPLIAAYQRFYEAEEIDEERNRSFFRRFLAPSEDGLLLGARQEGRLVGYACLYWHFSSTRAVETVLMNDLFVSELVRGSGVGRALIEATVEVARERGVDAVEWSTAPDNHTGLRLYDSTGAKRSEWISYELEV
jgi:GNAT superfamily N-acetyltransferase